MKEKILIIICLCVILIGVMPTVKVKAENTETDIDKLLNEACSVLVADSTLTALLTKYPNYAIGYNYSKQRVEMIVGDNEYGINCLRYCYGGIYLCNDSSNKPGNLYYYKEGKWVSGSSGAVGIGYYEDTVPKIVASNFDYIVGLPLSDNIPSVFEYVYGYTFVDWCTDANLNCTASSKESSSVIPYSYSSYVHIVRKTSTGKWLLTTIGNSVYADNETDYTFLLSEDYGKIKVWNLYSGEDVNGYLLNVRQYYYETDGWKMLSYNTYDSRDTDDLIIDLGNGSGIDSTKVFSYSSVDMYTETGLELVVGASIEYGDIQIEIPDDSGTSETPTTPTPTKTPVIDLSGLDITLKLEEITTTGFKYNGIEYKWGNIKTHIDSKDLEDYAVFYNDYKRQIVFVWAFDDLMVQGKLNKSGLRYYEYFFEFITNANNSSVLPYAIITYQINSDGTLTETGEIYTEENEKNHQFEFAWTTADYKPRLDDFSTFDTYVSYVLGNNLVVSNCNIYNNSGVLVSDAVNLDNSKIAIEEIPDSEFGVLKKFLYEKLPIIGTIEVFVAKFKAVLNTMKETNKAPEIIMNVKDFYGYTGELNVLDLSWYEPYRELVKAIISALLIVPFILWVYRKGLPDAIGGI